jgi:hypothetical protein
MLHAECVILATQEEFTMPMDEVIDGVIATCDGDMRGAIQALLLVNERLETELQYFYEMATHQSPRLQPSAEPADQA